MLRKIIFKSDVAVALLLSVLVAIAYAPIVNLSFLYDDFAVVRTVALPNGDTNWWLVLKDFYSPFLGLDAPLYRPLYALLWGINYSLYGTNPLGYHLTNLVLHAISSFLVYLVALELIPGDRKRWVAITAGAIFVLHPIHPEAVTFIAGGEDVLCAVFYLSALLFFLRWLRTEQSFYIALSLGLFVLSLLSKEMAAALPGLLFLCAIYKRKKVTVAILSVVPFASTLGIYLLLRSYLLSDTRQDIYDALQPALTVRVFEDFLLWTLQTLFFPLNLGLLPNEWLVAEDNGTLVYTAIPLGLILAVGSITLIAVSVVAARYFGADWKLQILLFALYVVSLAPVFRALYWNPVLIISRWFYIPSAFLSIFIAYVLWSVLGRYVRRALAPSIAAGLVCVAYFAMLVANNGVWLQAGEIAEEHLRSGEEPKEDPRTGVLFYKGVGIFTPVVWEVANSPPFKKP